jgi:YD repeat-containing protein
MPFFYNKPEFAKPWLIFSLALILMLATAHGASYDSSGRLIKTAATNGLQIGYSFDPAGNITVMTVTAAGGSVPVLTSDLAVIGQLGTAFNFTLTSSKPSSTFTATGLPPGLSVTNATGVIAGTWIKKIGGTETRITDEPYLNANNSPLVLVLKDAGLALFQTKIGLRKFQLPEGIPKALGETGASYTKLTKIVQATN